ncbi:hypothetical protein [Priestia endophytica]|uniref:Relaxasome subunit MobC n=1 Tax=Priestia endophytica DSM 13796 TaxID=1121089 RepID=A0A1I6C7A8_9BACI|nr:hypothetical protein [Priestia endophytica]KYG33494.1 hypothetical protein AZF06_21870 [Priestia endophytica]SFQ89069.1 hypothetical protein SAMN02745910_05190 [Priestia endophytica DSM 13796]
MRFDSWKRYEDALDKIDKLEKRKKVLKDHSKISNFKKEPEERRQRTRRLIEKGALFEKYIEQHLEENQLPLEPKDAELLLDVFSSFFKANQQFVINKWNERIENKKSSTLDEG